MAQNPLLPAALPFLIEIIKCSQRTYWYDKNIGKKMFVIEHDKSYYNVVKLFADYKDRKYYKTGFIINKFDAVIAVNW